MQQIKISVVWLQTKYIVTSKFVAFLIKENSKKLIIVS